MKRTKLSIVLSASIAWLLSLDSASCQTPAAQTTNGLPVGARAPGFNLKDQDGKEHALADLLRKGTAALVFYRSADW